MTVTHDPFLLFIQLVELDQQINTVRMHQEQNSRAQDDLKQKLEDRRSAAAHMREKAHDVRKRVAAHELSVKTAQAQEKKVRHKMDFVGSPKEYAALEAELKELEKQKNAAEEAVFELWPELETAEAQAIAADQQVKLFEADVAAKIVELQVATTSHAAELRTLEAQRAESVMLAPEEYVKKYETMRASVSNPVVPVIGLECSACAHEVTGTMMTQLKKHLLVTCPECYRLLYRV